VGRTLLSDAFDLLSDAFDLLSGRFDLLSDALVFLSEAFASSLKGHGFQEPALSEVEGCRTRPTEICHSDLEQDHSRSEWSCGVEEPAFSPLGRTLLSDAFDFFA